MPKGSILVVDDELEIREGLEALLKSEGFDVTLAETGEAGLQKLDDHPFDSCCLTSACPIATASKCSAKFARAIRSSPSS